MIPSRITAGDTLVFPTTSGTHPATDGWTLTHVLVPRTAGRDPITFAGAADGQDYTTTVAASTTAGWDSGEYTWATYVAKAGERFTIARGTTTIVPDPTQAEGGYDPRSSAAKIVDAIDAMLVGRASVDQSEYEISVGGSMRRLKYCTKTELIELRSHYALIAQQEAGADAIQQGLGNPRKHFVRFRGV